jgi:hypothetical protein
MILALHITRHTESTPITKQTPTTTRYYNYPGHPGYHPIDATAPARPRSHSRPESAEDRMHRQEGAKHHVEELADKSLAAEKARGSGH